MSFWDDPLGWLMEPAQDSFAPDGQYRDLLWLFVPGFFCFDEAGKRARWPALYRARDQRHKALAAGAVPAHSEIGHQLSDDYCQFGIGHLGGGQIRCELCFPWAQGTYT